MYTSLSDFFKDIKDSGVDWLKSQLKMSAITFVLLIVGLFVIDQKIVPIAWAALIPFIALAITIVDFIPTIGISTCMLPWAVIDALFVKPDGTKAGLAIFILYVIFMLIKQILEPFVRGKSLGISPIEEVVSAVAGYFVFSLFGISAVGFVAGPLLYIITKKVYTKFNPDGFFSMYHEPSYLKRDKNNEDGEVIDISDDVVDVDEIKDVDDKDSHNS